MESHACASSGSSDEAHRTTNNEGKTVFEGNTSSGSGANFGNTYGGDHIQNYQSGGGADVYNILNCTIQNSLLGGTGNTINIINNSDGGCQKNVEERLDLLRERTWKQAKLLTGQFDSPVQQRPRIRIAPVPLLIRKDMRSGDQLSHSKQQEIEFKRRTSPYYFHRLKMRDDESHYVTVQDLFKAAQCNASNGAYSCDTKEEQEIYIRRHGNAVVVTGQAGGGKTTVCRELTRKVLFKELLEEVEFVFYTEGRHIDCEKSMTVLDFIITSCRIQWAKDPQIDSKVVENLNSKKALFVFDGLDETSHHHMKASMKSVGLSIKATSADFIKGILRGDLFPNSFKLASSRPGLLFNLPDSHRPQFIVEVIGLEPESQDQLCKQICGYGVCGKLVSEDIALGSDDTLQSLAKANYEEVRTVLTENAQLSSFCHVPVICILVMNCILLSITAATKFEMKTMAGIYVYSLYIYLKSQHLLPGADELYSGDMIVQLMAKLSRIASIGMKSGKQDFEHADVFGDVGENVALEKALIAFINPSLKANTNLMGRILEGEQLYFFTHFTFQELFVAIDVGYFLSYDDFKREVEENCGSDQWEVVTDLLLGFLDDDVSKLLSTIFSSGQLPEAKPNFSSDKKHFLKSWLINRCSSTYLCSSDPSYKKRVLKSWSIMRSMRTTIKFVSFDREDTSEIDDSVEMWLGLNDAHSEILIPNRFMSLCNLLGQCGKALRGEVTLIQSAAEHLPHILHVLPGIDIIKDGVEFSNLMNVLNHLPATSTLHLCFLEYYKDGRDDDTMFTFDINDVLEKLKDFSGKLKVLHEDSLDLNDFSTLVSTFQRTQVRPRIRFARAATANHPSLLIKEIRINVSEISGLSPQMRDAINSFGSSTLKIEKLKISLSSSAKAEITIENCKKWCDTIRELMRVTRRLSISDGFCRLKVYEIHRRKWSHNASRLGEAAAFVANQLLDDAPQVTELTLYMMKLPEKGFQLICGKLQNIYHLTFRYCDISNRRVEILAEAIKSLDCKFLLLDLSENKDITEDGVRALCPVLDNIQELIISDCSVGNEGLKLIADKLKTFPDDKQLQTLDLSFNKRITDDGVRELCPVLDRVQELNLGHCNICTEGAEMIAKKAASFPGHHQGLLLDVDQNRIRWKGIDALVDCSMVTSVHDGSLYTLYHDYSELPFGLQHLQAWSRHASDEDERITDFDDFSC